MATTEDVQLSLKLVVNKDTNKVLFAEAEKDFVDVLFSFLTLPLGTIVRLLEKQSNMGPVTIGCLNSLYHCVTGLHNCLLTQSCKEILLQPRNSSEDYCNTLKLNIDDTDPRKYFKCSRLKCCWLSFSATQKYCWCRHPLSLTVFLKHLSNGFVNASVATFVITDDLVVMPNSLDYTSFALLQNLGIKNPRSVMEMTVNVTKEKVLDLLKCSLLSKSCLTDLFLEKKPILKRSTFFSFSSTVENGSSIKITFKLVIKKSDGKILYAQGEKDFVDMLLSFLTFPLGGVVRKLGGNCSVGSIDGLYKNIPYLNEDIYFVSEEAKNRLVNPHIFPQFQLSKQILPILEPSVLKYYCHYRNINNEGIIHLQFFKADKIEPDENFRLMTPFGSESLTGGLEGFVKGPAMYMATDDLVVTPCSPISALNLINRLNTLFDDLKEKVVTIGIKECLGILKASLTSTSALTNGLGHLLTEVKKEK